MQLSDFTGKEPYGLCSFSRIQSVNVTFYKKLENQLLINCIIT